MLPESAEEYEEYFVTPTGLVGIQVTCRLMCEDVLVVACVSSCSTLLWKCSEANTHTKTLEPNIEGLR